MVQGTYWRHQNLVELCLVPRSMEGFFFDELRGVTSPRLDAIRHRPAAVVDDPSATVRVLEWGQVRRTIEVDSTTGGTLLWRIAWFPGMEVTVDGNVVDAFEHRGTGLVANRLAPGLHTVRWTWRPFPALTVARWISCAAAALLVAVVAWIAICSRTRSRGGSDNGG